MATTSGGNGINFGVHRHYAWSFYPYESIFFNLVTDAGVPYQNGVLSTNVKATAYFPDGTNFDLHTSAPANTLLLGNNASGLYRLILWGEGAAGGHDAVLAQVGTIGIRIYPTAGEFIPLAGFYEVRPDFDVNLAVTYLPGTSGSDQITGCITIYRWWSKDRLEFPLTATGAARGTSVISSLTLKITDKDSSSNILSLSSGTTGDFSENAFDGNLYFTKAITGLTGARVLTARIQFTYKGYIFNKDFLLPSRFAA